MAREHAGEALSVPAGTRYDAVVIGAGPGGEVVASRLASAGRCVALAERELIGGECAYWACIPSKTLLRPVEVRADATRAAGTGTPRLRWREATAYRDYMVRHLDDAKQVEGYRRDGVAVYKAAARIAAPGRVEVGGETLHSEHVVVATGSHAVVPPIDGLQRSDCWTNREATTLDEVPEAVVVLGGGPVGIELGQMLRRHGARVTLVESAARLLLREDPAVSELIARALADDGIEVLTGEQAVAVAGGRVRLESGRQLDPARLVVAVGRAPRVDGLGLETVGVRADEHGIAVDERCRAAEGVWAVGDVTGVMPFTHVAKYQARIVCDAVAGRDVRADYRGVPRVVFLGPRGGGGRPHGRAGARGGHRRGERPHPPARAARRPWTYERDPRGELELVADRTRGVLVGAWAVAPLAAEWIHPAALAIRAAIPLRTLRDFPAQFPTFTEAYLKAVERL
jgi:pyruvate/2-oxoglutarate dehydrogenase complex dihydrolipoamide dehydrogenase (E3) component